MNYSIQAGKHSADKDHTAMTGGTLSIDKTVSCDTGVTFYIYSIPLYQAPFDESFHKGVHTAEHLLAYKKDTGSVRNTLEEVTNGEISGKVILDISPYQTGENTFGFRITSMIPLSVEKVKEFTKISISRAIDFLEKGEAENEDDFMGIPFARAIACGQFTFHDKEKAIEDLKKTIDMELRVEEVQISSTHKIAYVCDLRFLKPKTSENDTRIMFSPDFSYRVSRLIEKQLPKKLPGSIAIVGTFGCMTGMYLCVSSETGDETDIPTIHATIIEILQEHIDIEFLGEDEQKQLTQIFENYENFGKK